MPIRFRRRMAAALATAAAVTGCADSGSTSAGNGGDAASAKSSAALPSTSTSSDKAAKPQTSVSASSSGIAGDRMTGPVTAPPKIEQKPSPFRFEDIAKSSGIDFVHVSGMTEQKHFPTANGSGLALFDYDGDGKLDIYFASATHFPLGSKTNSGNKLYKNLGGGKFQDVTAASGVGFAGFTHGAIAGDFDNDGDADLFLATYHQDRLFENRGDGTFADITQAAGILQGRWSSSGVWFDYDHDGDLDLYVSAYGKWELADAERFCGDTAKNVRLYCNPRSIATVPHVLYRNNGNKTFTNAYDQFLVDSAGQPMPGRTDGRGFGIVAADLNGDGLTDLYVANDMCPNFLFLNKGGGKFEDATELSGAAFDAKGQAQSGMGAECNDTDGDGRLELFCTNFSGEYNTLYQNMGNGAFLDNTAFAGLAAASMPWVGWGCVLEDFDSDGWPDCMVANGHVDDNRHLIGQDVPYAEPPLLFRNAPLAGGPNATRRFELSTMNVGPYFSSDHVARGLAYGDLDNDGDIDIVVNHKDGSPAILINQTPLDGNSWIQLKLIGTKSNRDAVGARVEVHAGVRTIHRARKGGCSLMSTNDSRVTIGLGPGIAKADVTVRWPSGATAELKGVAVNQALEIKEQAP